MVGQWAPQYRVSEFRDLPTALPGDLLQEFPLFFHFFWLVYWFDHMQATSVTGHLHFYLTHIVISLVCSRLNYIPIFYREGMCIVN